MKASLKTIAGVPTHHTCNVCRRRAKIKAWKEIEIDGEFVYQTDTHWCKCGQDLVSILNFHDDDSSDVINKLHREFMRGEMGLRNE